MPQIMLPVALTAAGASAMLSIWLGLRISRLRLSRRISVGDGGDSLVATRMRAQANFTEYAPLVLILIALVELARGTTTWLWVVALAFVLGRIAHAFGMEGNIRLRQVGIVTTWAILIGLGIYAATLPFTAPARPAGMTMLG